MVSCPAWRTGATILDRGRRGHRSASRRPPRPPVMCSRSTRPRPGLLHRRQHRDERRRQEGRAVGHRAGQPWPGGAWSRPDANGWKCAAGPQPGQDPRRRRWRASELRCRRHGKHRRWRATERLDIPGSLFRKEGLGRTSPTSSSPACPGVQKGRLRRPDHQRRWVVHRMPKHTRTVCLEFFGKPKDAVPIIVEIRTPCSPRRSARRRILAGLEHLDDRYLKAVGYATKASAAGGRPAQDGADRRHRRRRRRRRGGAATSEVVRMANGRSGEGFVAVSADARKKFWLDRKRTAAIAPPHQRLQDQRGRGDPAAADGRVHRRHRAHQHRAACATRWSSCGCAGRPSSGPLPLGGDDADEIPGRRLLEDRVQQALALVREVRQWQLAGTGWTSVPESPQERRCSRSCRTTPARVEDADAKAAAGASSPARLRADPRGRAAGHPRRCSRAASGWRCITCTPATATCTPTSRSTATTTRCCRPRTGGGKRIMALARLDGVISASTASASPSWSS